MYLLNIYTIIYLIYYDSYAIARPTVDTHVVFRRQAYVVFRETDLSRFMVHMLDYFQCHTGTMNAGHCKYNITKKLITTIKSLIIIKKYVWITIYNIIHALQDFLKFMYSFQCFDKVRYSMCPVFMLNESLMYVLTYRCFLVLWT